MSFNVTVTGHSTDPHNDTVKGAAVAFANALKETLGEGATVTLSGYSGDSTGYITFGDADRFAPGPAAETATPPESAVAPEVDATPKALEHAEATGVDITQVEGTGAGGKVTKADVEAAAAENASTTPAEGA